MSRRTSKVLTLGLIMLLALSASAVIMAKRECPCVDRRLIRQILRQPYQPGREVEFRLRMSGSGTTPDGGRFDGSQYLSSDCVKVIVTYYYYISPGKATEWFDSRVKDGRTIYPQTSALATAADRRAVLWVRPQNSYQILHLSGSRILEIESSSLKHAVEYERRLGMAIGSPAN